MRRYIMFLISILLINEACAQELKLKPGQKFSYETLSETKRPIGIYLHHDITYTLLNIEVLRRSNDQFELNVLIRRKITYNNYGNSGTEIIKDTQNKTINYLSGGDAVDHILSNTPFHLTIDKKGHVVNVSLDAVKKEALKEINKIPIDKLAQPVDEQIKNTLNEKYFFKNYAFWIFQTGLSSISVEQKKDSVYTYKGREVYFSYANGHRDTVINQTDDTVKILKLSGRNNKYGLTEYYRKDSLINGVYVQDKKPHVNTSFNQVALIASGMNAIHVRPSLLSEFKIRTSYDDYFSARKSVFREVSAYTNYYLKNKGEFKIKENLLHKLDSLDRQLPKNDYEYLATKTLLLSCIDYDSYEILIDTVSAEYLTSAFDVIKKAEISYKHNNIPDFIKALNILFTKFTTGTQYPQNIHLLAYFIDTTLAKEIKDTDDPVSLQQMLNTFIAIKRLNISVLTEMFAGVKSWTNAKLAITKNELKTAAEEKFNSRYVNAGRYRILIYNILIKKAVADSVSAAYLDLTISQLDGNLAQLELVNSNPNEDFMWKISVPENRTKIRKYLADAWYLKSMSDKKHQLQYLQIAADYCPDQEGQNNLNFIEIENNYFLSQDYRDLYIKKANLTGKTEDFLSRYVDMVILEPQRYARLKVMYKEKYPAGDFKTFFSETLQKKLPKSPEFRITETLGKVAASKDNFGKWVFIDFWGTWCGACVSEIDKIQDIFQNNPATEKLEITTIACFDKLDWVNHFMSSKGFTFPVILSDNLVEKKFKIVSYPTKVLVLPNRHYLIVPYRDDYKSLLKQYLSWDI